MQTFGLRDEEDVSQPALNQAEEVLYVLDRGVASVILDIQLSDWAQERDSEGESAEASPSTPSNGYSFDCAVFVTTDRLILLHLCAKPGDFETANDKSLAVAHTSIGLHGLSATAVPPSVFVSLDELFVRTLSLALVQTTAAQASADDLHQSSSYDKSSLQRLYNALSEAQVLNPPSDYSDPGDAMIDKEAIGQMEASEKKDSATEAETTLLSAAMDCMTTAIPSEPTSPEFSIERKPMDSGIVVSEALSDSQRAAVLAHLESVMTVTDSLPSESAIAEEMLANGDDVGVFTTVAGIEEEFQEAVEAMEALKPAAETRLDDEAIIGDFDSYFGVDSNETQQRELDAEEEEYYEEEEDYYEEEDSVDSALEVGASVQLVSDARYTRWVCDAHVIKEAALRGQFQELRPEEDTTFEYFRKHYPQPLSAD